MGHVRIVSLIYVRIVVRTEIVPTSNLVQICVCAYKCTYKKGEKRFNFVCRIRIPMTTLWICKLRYTLKRLLLFINQISETIHSYRYYTSLKQMNNHSKFNSTIWLKFSSTTILLCEAQINFFYMYWFIKNSTDEFTDGNSNYS